MCLCLRAEASRPARGGRAGDRGELGRQLEPAVGHRLSIDAALDRLAGLFSGNGAKFCASNHLSPVMPKALASRRWEIVPPVRGRRRMIPAISPVSSSISGCRLDVLDHPQPTDPDLHDHLVPARPSGVCLPSMFEVAM